MRTSLQTYQKTKNFVPKECHISPQISTILTAINLNDVFTMKQLCDKQDIKELFSEVSSKRLQRIVSDAVFFGQRLNILEKYFEKGCSFEEFIAQPLIDDWISNMRGSKFNHKESQTLSYHGLASTQYLYANYVWHFNNWLAEKSIIILSKIINEEGWSKDVSKPVKIEGMSHFVTLYGDSEKKQNFLIMIKSYLNDPKHKGKNKATMDGAQYAIKSVFTHNELDFSAS